MTQSCLAVYRASVSVGLLLSMLVLTGCEREIFISGNSRVKQHDQVGSTHVAVLSVTPWADYYGELQPHFELSESQALGKVLPSTQQYEDKVIDALAASLQLAAKPGEAVASTDLPTPPDSPAKDRKASELGTAEKVFDSAKLGTDPMLQHLLATALYQEVKLLNRYIDDANFRAGYVPYIVRLQVGVMPTTRDMSYDTYIDISMFEGITEHPTGEGGIPKATSAVSDAPNLATQSCNTAKNSDSNNSVTQNSAPKIVPLLVTDNMESALQSRSINNIRQFAIAISAMAQSFGGQIGSTRQIDQLQSVLGQEANSTLTMARLNDSTVRVRLGAVNSTIARYAIVPRTHDVTLVVFLKADDVRTNQLLSVVSRSHFTDVKTGREIPERNRYTVEAKIRQIVDEFALAKGQNRDCVLKNMRKAATAVLNDNKGQFKESLKAIDGVNESNLPAIWTRLTALQAGSQYHHENFVIPGVSGIDSTLPGNQDALLIDDGKTTTTMLHDGKALSRAKLKATLKFLPKTATDPKQMATLAPTKVTVDGDGALVTLTFPSLKAWNLTPDNSSKLCAERLTLSGFSGHGTPLTAEPLKWHYLYVAPKPTPKIKLTVVPEALAPDNNTHRATFGLSITVTDKTKAGKATLDVVGASLEPIVSSATNTLSLTAKDGHWTINGTGGAAMVTINNITADTVKLIVKVDDKPEAEQTLAIKK